MEYFLAEAVYNTPLPCSQEDLKNTLLPRHGAHIAAGAADGRVLLAGPKTGGGGGVLVLRGRSAAEVRAFLDADPLVTAGVQTFRVVPFAIYEHAPILDGWLAAPGAE